MARFASLIRGGYYRLSDANTDAVATLIRAATHDSYGSDYYKLRPYTLLDPFCGEGIALAALATGLHFVFLENACICSRPVCRDRP